MYMFIIIPQNNSRGFIINSIKLYHKNLNFYAYIFIITFSNLEAKPTPLKKFIKIIIAYLITISIPIPQYKSRISSYWLSYNVIGCAIRRKSKKHKINMKYLVFLSYINRLSLSRKIWYPILKEHTHSPLIRNRFCWNMVINVIQYC